MHDLCVLDWKKKSAKKRHFEILNMVLVCYRYNIKFLWSEGGILII